jgi:putative CocE/NonD family hydrolase
MAMLCAIGSGVAAPQAPGGPSPYGRPPEHTEIRSFSFYLPMNDGVELAIDVHLPRDLESGQRIPTILHQTRYWRSLDIRLPFDFFVDGRFLLWGSYRRYFVSRGYAWVDVDVRGTGASFGTWKHSYWEREVSDGATVVDWIVAQPWSSGKVGAWGVSYAGGAAEFLLVNQHPAVRAATPMFSPFDVYDEIGFPGGMRARWYIDRWAEVNRQLDSNDPPVDIWYQRMAVRGVRPVDGADGPRRLREALSGRNGNVDVDEEADHITFRDDSSPRIAGIDRMSPHAFVKQIDAARVPIYSYSGWLDGAYQHAAIRRFLTLSHPESKLIIGPWDHGGAHNVSPFVRAKARFDHRAEILKFFDFHLLGLPTEIDREPRVHYYTMGAEVWRSSSAWPPRGLEELRLQLAEDGRLTEAPEVAGGRDDFRVDMQLGTGSMSRWTALVGPTESAILYPNQDAFSNQSLSYTSAPLTASLEVTGHPMVTLHISGDAGDAAVFVVLEDVAPDKSVRYVTEGSLRALHRGSITQSPPYRDAVPVRLYDRARAEPLDPGEVVELSFDLLPTSYQFAVGHALRLSIAGVDADYFDPIAGATTLRIHRGGEHPSGLTVPVRPEAAPMLH